VHVKSTRIPTARRENLVVRELPDETLVYDVRSHKAHCLNRTAALVWRACDGTTPVAEIAARVGHELALPCDAEMIRAALVPLARARLLEHPLPKSPVSSRRQALRRLGWGLAAPVVASILAPTLAEAVTCVAVADCQNLAKCDQSAASKCCDRRPCCEIPGSKCLPKGISGQQCGCA
jgi:coenzyme PQQ synthesis protein D (PqqD)